MHRRYLVPVPPKIIGPPAAAAPETEAPAENTETLDEDATADSTDAATRPEETGEKCCIEAKRSRLTVINESSRKALAVQGKLCPTICAGRECSYGDSCRFDHDVATFLASKPADLGDVCPNVAATGTCPFGVRCRFMTKGHAALDKSEPLPSLADKMVFRVDDLRKKQVKFPRAAEYMAAVSAKTLPESYPFGERRQIDFTDKTYLAPLTTTGNLPFRRICKEYGVDITCGEMALANSLMKGNASEWALMKRHASEDVFGVQICGGWADTLAQAAELIDDQVDCDFIDLNMGCPIDLVFKKGMGSGLMEKSGRVQQIVMGMASVMKNKALTVKMRTGVYDGKAIAHKLIPRVAQWGATAVTLHGRSREQRYSKEADWSYVSQCVEALQEMPEPTRPALIGNGDVFSWEDYVRDKEQSKAQAIMVARGALVKPWLFTEIKEQRHWDISSSERFEMLKRYANYGLEHFGTDSHGVERTRRFMLEWMGFLHRYVPVGIIERLPQRLNQRPPAYYGRDELETLMASTQAEDWMVLAERILGKAPDGFKFTPKHKSNSYSTQG